MAGFYNYLQANFPEEIYKTINTFGKLSNKYVKVSGRKEFLNTCKKQKLVPTFLQSKDHHLNFQKNSNKEKYINNKLHFQMTTLSLLINETHISLNEIKQKIVKIKEKIDKLQLPTEIIFHLLKVITRKNYNLKDIINKSNEKK